jgi:hypothetical protein
MSDSDIDGLLFILSDPHHSRYSAALRMIVAERNALKQRVEDMKAINSTATRIIAERDALKQRVAELEAQLPADRELRERLVCAIWPELLRIHSEYAKHPAVKGDPREQARRFALIEADEMLAAMRKEEQP